MPVVTWKKSWRRFCGSAWQMSIQDWQSRWGWWLSAALDKICRAGVGYDNEDECLALGWWKGKPCEAAVKMFKARSQKYSICNHILGTEKKHAALTDNEPSQEPHRLERTKQLEILWITITELCPGALTLGNLGWLHFKLCLSLQPASQPQWSWRAQLPSRHPVTALKFFFVPPRHRKETNLLSSNLKQ